MRLSIPSSIVNYYQGRTPRERVLLLITGGAVAFILNLLLISVLLNSSRDLGAAYAEKSAELRSERLFASQKDALWVPREAWLKKNQPFLSNRNVEGSKLQETVLGFARGSQVILTGQQILPPALGGQGDAKVGKADYQAVTLKVSTQSDWKSVVKFMAALQQPEAFLVFDSAGLRTEQNDSKKMLGEFVISKWYAPVGK